MFIIEITYKKPTEFVELHLSAHREFLDVAYQNSYFLASGPKNPRTGGIIISQLSNSDQLNDILKEDPFWINEVADYKIIEFNPTKYHSNFIEFIRTVAE